RPERRHSRQHRRILATGARLFAAQLFVARTLTAHRPGSQLWHELRLGYRTRWVVRCRRVRVLLRACLLVAGRWRYAAAAASRRATQQPASAMSLGRRLRGPAPPFGNTRLPSFGSPLWPCARPLRGNDEAREGFRRLESASAFRVLIIPLDGLGSSIAFAPTVAASSTSSEP